MFAAAENRWATPVMTIATRQCRTNWLVSRAIGAVGSTYLANLILNIAMGLMYARLAGRCRRSTRYMSAPRFRVFCRRLLQCDRLLSATAHIIGATPSGRTVALFRMAKEFRKKITRV